MKKHWLDRQHRGFQVYRRETEGHDPQWNRAVVAQSNGAEALELVLTDCQVKTDWIDKIEQVLPFVEDAIRQSRQFILRQGETVPIEKAKQVSRATVEHLSRHSQLITTMPEPDKPLIPEKLYITENVGTYAIYENRFLYMLLSYIRDFVDKRYRKIREAMGVTGHILLEKDFSDENRTVTVSLRYTETSRDPEETANEQTAAAIARIRDILQIVETLLRSGLMREVAQAPMLRPPVVRTNVMMHDRNFKEAVELYTFLESYVDDGFHVVERCLEKGPFSSQTRQDMADWLALTSYLPYRAGLYAALEARYLEEEQRRQEEELLRCRKELERLRSCIGTDEGAALAYILALEKQNAQLEQHEDRLMEEETRHRQTQESLAQALSQNRHLEDRIRSLEQRLREHGQQMQMLTDSYARATDQQKTERQRLESELKQQQQEFQREYAQLAERYRLAKARNHAAGQMEADEEFVSREGFAALEAEFKAFQKFYEQQWKQVKKQIRQERLWKKK